MSSVDDETTIARAEIEEGKSARDELAELEAEVDLPIESLLEQYQQGALHLLIISNCTFSFSNANTILLIINTSVLLIVIC